MSVDENLLKNIDWSSQSMRSTRRTGSIAFKRWSSWSATLFNYCAGMKIIPEARLPIYQKFSMAHKVTWHLRVLRQLKCLPALKTSRKPQNYTDMTLLICWAVWRQTWGIYTRQCITKINFSRCKITQKTLEMQPNQGFKRTIHSVAERVMILLAIPVIQPLPPVPMAPQSIQRMRDWA